MRRSAGCPLADLRWTIAVRAFSPSLVELLLEPPAVGAKNFARTIPVPPTVDLGLLGFEELVRLEEVLDLDQPMRLDIVEALYMRLVGVTDGHA